MTNSSSYWINHFTENLQQLRINWSTKASISLSEKKNIIPSLQAWQLGETSDGAHLLHATALYSKKIEDSDYLEAVTLFIKEEQKHGENLGRYLDLIGEKRITKNWGDSLFRKVRYFNTSMEIWTATVIIVESFAQLYYKAVTEATECKLLRSICSDILIDEAHHIRFQLERLQILLLGKNFWSARLSIFAYRVLFEAITIAVWIGHKKVFRSAGIDFVQYSYQSQKKFLYIQSQLLRTIHSVRNEKLLVSRA